ncbi:MAG: ABC transporter substrate-binding protein [Actinobacteria bacterium]|nr:ABC transporter substrate-binding protein [Actinomycetota bacterium]
MPRLSPLGSSRPDARTTAERGQSRRGRLVAMVLAVVLLGAACGDSGGTDGTAGTSDTTAGDGTAEATEVRIAYVPATTGLLLHVAEQQGYFEENGLDVTLTPAANISEIPPTLGRQFEISLGTATDLIRAANGGLDVVQVQGNTNSTEDNPFVQLIVGKDSGIEDVSGLEGKRVASPTLTGVIHVATLYWAQQEGVDPSSIEGVQVPPPNLPDQLNAGQADAVEALEPFASQLLAAGHESLGDPFAAIRLPLATNFWIANGEWAGENGDVVEGFRTSLEQALEFVEENEPEARTILQGYTDMPPQVAERVPLPTFNLEIWPDDLATWIDVLEEMGEDIGDVEADQLVLDAGE